MRPSNARGAHAVDKRPNLMDAATVSTGLKPREDYVLDLNEQIQMCFKAQIALYEKWISKHCPLLNRERSLFSSGRFRGSPITPNLPIKRAFRACEMLFIRS